MLRPHRPFSIRSVDIASVRDVILLSFWFHFTAYLLVAASSIALSIPFQLKGDIWSFGFDICVSAAINGILWSAAYWSVIVTRWLLSRRVKLYLGKSERWTLWGAWVGVTVVPIYLYADLLASLAAAGNESVREAVGAAATLSLFPLIFVIISPLPATFGATLGRLACHAQTREVRPSCVKAKGIRKTEKLTAALARPRHTSAL